MPETTFVVKAGSTLSGIAKKFGVPLGVLIDANGITDPNRIKVGQVLRIPAMTTDSMDHAPVAAPKPAGPATVASPKDLAINRTKFRLPVTCFFDEPQEKDLILLHYTAGTSARSAFDTWVAAANRVATAYIVDVDGTVYELFDPKCWAFHLGLPGNANPNHIHHRRSIAIEIANVGMLKPDAAKPNQLNWWPADFGTKFCTLAETGKYVKKSYRGFDFYATFPDVQMDSVCKLVRLLCEQFGIDKKIPPASKRDAFDVPFATSFQGVISHQSFRADKFDVGPAFDWSKIFGS